MLKPWGFIIKLIYLWTDARDLIKFFIKLIFIKIEPQAAGQSKKNRKAIFLRYQIFFKPK